MSVPPFAGRLPAACAAVFMALSAAGTSWANFGFAPSPEETCLVALEDGQDGPFYWTTKERLENHGDSAWRRVFRDPDFRAKYEERYRNHFDVMKPIGPAAEPLVALPEGMTARKEPCLATWTRHWRHLAATTPQADPARAVGFAFDPLIVKKGVVNIEDVGTGFFISKDGLLITNYHVAKFICPVPKKGNRDAAIPCKGGYTLLSFTDWEDYVGGHDFALLRAPKVDLDMLPLPLRAELPRKWERVFLAGFPTQTYAPEFFKGYARTKIYPARNSGKRGPLGFLRWDPLVFSTGRLATALDVTHLFPDSPRKIILGSSHDSFDRDTPSFALQEWDQDLEPSPEEVPSGPGSSGSPLMDAAGRVVGILHRDDMYYSSLIMVEALDLCNRLGSKDPRRAALAAELAGPGLCPSLAPAEASVAVSIRRIGAGLALPDALFDGRPTPP